MRSEYTRQTRWAGGPETVDPTQTPPGSTYVLEMIWLTCTTCDLQVHASRLAMLAHGVFCPECGRQLAPAATAEEQTETMGKVCEEESRFRRRLQG